MHLPSYRSNLPPSCLIARLTDEDWFASISPDGGKEKLIRQPFLFLMNPITLVVAADDVANTKQPLWALERANGEARRR